MNPIPNSLSFRLAAAHKPHTGSVRSVRVAATTGGASRGAVATVGGDGVLFFFVLDLTVTIGHQLTPTRFVIVMQKLFFVKFHGFIL